MIETPRLRLRPFNEDDLQVYHEMIFSNADVTRFLPGGKPRPLEGTKTVLDFAIAHQKKHGFSIWAVERRADYHFLGHCGLVYLRDTPQVEVAYAFGTAFWGQGYATETARASLQYGFQTLKLDRILALSFPDNIASQRVMQKIGMRHQGETEQYYQTRLVLYTADRADWPPA